MLPSPTLLGLTLGLATAANAAMIEFFSDLNCGIPAGARNLYDNTCAYTGGFQSFWIVSPGGSSQMITAYSRNACVAPRTACVPATEVYYCHRAVNGHGGSNAISSMLTCN